MKVCDLPPHVREQVPHLIAKLADAELPQPRGWQLLVLQYQRPERIGSIYLSDKTRDEDRYQGRVGLVLAEGERAWSGDRFPSGPWAGPGDWVIWPTAANASSRFEYMGVTMALLPDTSVLATIPPEVDMSKVGNG